MKKTCTFLTVLMLTLASFTASSASLRGDVNQDGSVTIADVTALIDYLLTGNASAINPENADSNKDGSVGIADVTALIDRLLTGNWPSEEQNHDYVDLGLPSGTLWATCNVGANSPEDYGNYYAWGETEPKEFYDFINYKWCNGEYGTITKYTNRYDELEPEDDAATANWGGEWCMPTYEQMKELGDQCTWEPEERNGVFGYLATGPNGNKLFLPAAGIYWEEPYNDGLICNYWSRTLYAGGPFDPNAALCMNIDQWGVSYENYLSYRVAGRSVRPVRVSQN